MLLVALSLQNGLYFLDLLDEFLFSRAKKPPRHVPLRPPSPQGDKFGTIVSVTSDHEHGKDGTVAGLTIAESTQTTFTASRLKGKMTAPELTPSEDAMVPTSISSWSC